MYRRDLSSLLPSSNCWRFSACDVSKPWQMKLLLIFQDRLSPSCCGELIASDINVRKTKMTMLRQISDRNRRTRTFDPRHATLVCLLLLLLLLLVICSGLLYEVKPPSLKNLYREISLLGRKELRLQLIGEASRSERIEEKAERVGGKRGGIVKLQESNVGEEDGEVGDDERGVTSDVTEEEEEEELAERDDLVDEEEEMEEEEREDEEQER